MTVIFATTQFQFRSGMPLYLAMLFAAISAVIVVALYRREVGRISIGERIGLAFIRVLILCGLLFLCLGPAWINEQVDSRDRRIVVLIDNSASMTVRDDRDRFADQWNSAIAFDRIAPDRLPPVMPSVDDLPANTPRNPSRIELVRAALSNQRLGLLDKIRERGPVQVMSFGSSTTSHDVTESEWVKKLDAQQAQTALFETVAEQLQRDDNDLPAAFVIMTDGRDNASRRRLDDVAREAARLSIPLHIYGVGGTTSSQVQILNADIAETIFVDDLTAVNLRIRTTAAADAKVELVAMLGKREVARKTVDAGDEIRENLPFVPVIGDAGSGRQELSISAKLIQPGDTLTDEVKRSVRVNDRKLKVLHVDALPRWDYRFLQRALRRDRRVDAHFYLFDGDRRAMSAGLQYLSRFPENRSALFAYDLIIIGDVPATSLTSQQQQWLRDYVIEGGGLIHHAGKVHAPSSWVGTPLAEILPVDVPSISVMENMGRLQPFRPILSPSGLRNAMLKLENDPVESLRVWRTLPELDWSYPVTRLKPAAEVFMMHPNLPSADDTPMPVIAGHYFGKGYVLFIGCEELWRWRFNEAEKYFGRFWGQTVYSAGVPRSLGTKLAQLALDQSEPILGSSGQVYAHLFDEKSEPLQKDEVSATLTRLEVAKNDPNRVSTVLLKKITGQPGNYLASLPFNQVGQFTLTVDLVHTEPANLDYRVNYPANHELASGGMAEDDLRKLASATGGRFYREIDLHTMPGAITSKQLELKRVSEVSLWHPWAFALILALLTLEWMWRKWIGLS